MAKEELIEMQGKVTEVLPDSRYRVTLENGHTLVAYTAGKMKKFRIKTLAGDRVTVEMSPYDLEKGRLIFRHKDGPSGAPRAPPPPSVIPRHEESSLPYFSIAIPKPLRRIWFRAHQKFRLLTDKELKEELYTCSVK